MLAAPLHALRLTRRAPPNTPPNTRHTTHQEPFGLTLIEAAAHGVPIVATTHGGPVDIVHTLSNGILVDPTDEERVSEALLELLTNGATWDKCATNGVANINAYSWSSHCIKCLNGIEVEKVRGACRDACVSVCPGVWVPSGLGAWVSGGSLVD
jgi:glycosyltransferase involved in cell wall biosynthesis